MWLLGWLAISYGRRFFVLLVEPLGASESFERPNQQDFNPLPPRD